MAEASGPDQLLDRRRLRGKLLFWRTATVLFIGVLAISSLSKIVGPGSYFDNSQPHIAEIAIDGIITGAPQRIKLLQDLEENDTIKAVILNINSPGGTTSGGEALYEAILRLSDKKPVVATIDGIGTSAAYMAAIATDRVFARRASITGSIGVIFQSPNVSELLDKIGIQMEQIKSSPLKASPNPFEKTSPQAREAIQDLIDDSYAWFLDLVITRRGFNEETARHLADGRVYSGDRALKLKLIDALGSQEKAKTWLIETYEFDEDITVKRHVPEPVDTALERFTNSIFTGLLQAIGLRTAKTDLIDAVSLPRQLDGLLSLWHPSLD